MSLYSDTESKEKCVTQNICSKGGTAPSSGVHSEDDLPSHVCHVGHLVPNTLLLAVSSLGTQDIGMCVAEVRLKYFLLNRCQIHKRQW